MTVTATFQVSLDSYGHVPIVRVSGELDLRTVAALERALLRAISTSAHTVVDLSACTFIDSSGIGMIIRAQRLLRSRIGADPELRLIVREPSVIRTLELTGISEITRICSSLDEALAIDDTELAADLRS